MARSLRIEYPGAIHHVISRGNHRRSVFEDERDYRRLLGGLEQTFGRFGWDLLSFVLMPNRAVLGAVAEPLGIAADRFSRHRRGAVSRDLACWRGS